MATSYSYRLCCGDFAVARRSSYKLPVRRRPGPGRSAEQHESARSVSAWRRVAGVQGGVRCGRQCVGRGAAAAAAGAEAVGRPETMGCAWWETYQTRPRRAETGTAARSVRHGTPATPRRPPASPGRSSNCGTGVVFQRFFGRPGAARAASAATQTTSLMRNADGPSGQDGDHGQHPQRAADARRRACSASAGRARPTARSIPTTTIMPNSSAGVSKSRAAARDCGVNGSSPQTSRRCAAPTSARHRRSPSAGEVSPARPM